MGRRGLQIATGLLALVPILTGIITMLGVSDPLYASSGVPALPVLDSNLRFFGGVWLGLGLALIWLVPRIESESVLFRVVWGGIFLGGVGRLLSIVMVGAPPIPFIGFTALELIGAPLFVYWQHLVATAAARR
ncbi:DUF4345 domain-containing protein [Bradyrhizobium sp. 27S5]|uniref:DUF4345 domain-containing protein n=1 Tax=Bradyrhizobium sp. 27S5 TaxID=3139728 RepID=UPI0030CB672C